MKTSRTPKTLRAPKVVRRAKKVSGRKDPADMKWVDLPAKAKADLATRIRQVVNRDSRSDPRVQAFGVHDLIEAAVCSWITESDSGEVTRAEIEAAIKKRAAGIERRRRTRIVVYGIRSIDAEVFHYVGMTRSTNLRLTGHISVAKSAIAIGESRIFQDWLINEPSEKVLVVLEEMTGATGGHKKEIAWIRRLISKGHPLLNLHHHSDPFGKFRCRTSPCKTIAFSSWRSVALHRKDHKVEKCSLAAWPFAIDPDAPAPPRPVKPPRKRLFYAGVACDECGEPIPAREFFSFDVSHFTNDGGAYRVCTTCDINESQFEATDESGYDVVLAE